MAEALRVEETTAKEQTQDCGCGCGGALCGSNRQELVWVDSPEAAATIKATAETCGCGCECCG